MCTKIDSKDILFSFFSNSERDEITFKDLNQITRFIEEKNQAVYIDVTYKSIREAVIRDYDNLQIVDTSINIINKEEYISNFRNNSDSKIIEDSVKKYLKTNKVSAHSKR